MKRTTIHRLNCRVCICGLLHCAFPHTNTIYRNDFFCIRLEMIFVKLSNDFGTTGILEKASEIETELDINTGNGIYQTFIDNQFLEINLKY